MWFLKSPRLREATGQEEAKLRATGTVVWFPCSMSEREVRAWIKWKRLRPALLTELLAATPNESLPCAAVYALGEKVSRSRLEGSLMDLQHRCERGYPGRATKSEGVSDVAPGGTTYDPGIGFLVMPITSRQV